MSGLDRDQPAQLSNYEESEILHELKEFAATFRSLCEEVQRIIVGQDHVVQAVVSALFLNGHVLLEGLPGLGKTMLVRALGECLGLQFSRIQFTPDLMPADITGTRLIQQADDGTMTYKFEKGPIFTSLLLADEINRATPKTQSAMLEAMQERQVTIGGVSHPLPDPFVVLATQNPLELEGTYPLPEAQLDRFLFKVSVEYPDLLEVIEIMRRTTGAQDPELELRRILESPQKIALWRGLIRHVPIPRSVLEYGARLLLATQPDAESDVARRFVRFGASPRGLQAMILAGKVQALLDNRLSVKKEDLRAVALECLQHRIQLNFDAESQGVRVDGVVEQLLRQVR